LGVQENGGTQIFETSVRTTKTEKTPTQTFQIRLFGAGCPLPDPESFQRSRQLIVTT
jgi:hypothetical protein